MKQQQIPEVSSLAPDQNPYITEEKAEPKMKQIDEEEKKEE